MKRMVMIATGLLLLAGSAFAQPFPGLPDTAYVGLFADTGHSVRTVTFGGAPAIFHWYIFWLPSTRGLMAAEFKISAPSNVAGVTTVAKDPAITVELGTLTAGISIAFHADSCQSDWVWSHHLTSFLLNATQSQIELIEHPTLDPARVSGRDLRARLPDRAGEAPDASLPELGRRPRRAEQELGSHQEPLLDSGLSISNR